MAQNPQILQVLNALLATDGEARQRLADQYQDLLMTEEAAQMADHGGTFTERRVKKLEKALSIIRAIQEQEEADGTEPEEGA